MTNQRIQDFPANVEASLKGAIFPADKEDLLDHVERQEDSEEVLDFLHSLPEVTFDSSASVMQHLSEYEARAAS